MTHGGGSVLMTTPVNNVNYDAYITTCCTLECKMIGSKCVPNTIKTIMYIWFFLSAYKPIKLIEPC